MKERGAGENWAQKRGAEGKRRRESMREGGLGEGGWREGV